MQRSMISAVSIDPGDARPDETCALFTAMHTERARQLGTEGIAPPIDARALGNAAETKVGAGRAAPWLSCVVS